MIGQLIEKAGRDTLVFIVSDHGFCRGGTAVALNVWLRQHGYLHLLPMESGYSWERMKSRIPLLKYIARQYGHLQKKIVKGQNEKLFCETMLVHLRKIIDFERSRAFCLGGMGGLIYIVGPPDERKHLTAQIAKELQEDFGPNSQQPAIKTIRSGQDIYKNPESTVSTPDLVVEYLQGCESLMNPHGHEIITQKGSSGVHDQDGIIVVNGPGVQQNGEVNGNIVDVVPTIMSYLQLPVPKHLDGKVLSDMFDKPLEIRHEDVAPGNLANTVYTSEEQSKVEQQLSDLGYL